jgi:hypothetical protein
MKNKNKKNKNQKNWLLLFLMGSFLLKLFFWSKKYRKLNKIKLNFLEYIRQEEKQYKRYAQHKEGLSRFEKESCSLFKRYFIPCESNHYAPRLLRARNLTIMMVFLVVIKALVIGYFFFVQPGGGSSATLESSKVINLINNERKVKGEGILDPNTELDRAARAKAADMVSKNYFAHYSPDGKRPWDFINHSNYTYSFVGENLAMDFSTLETAHKALMASESHRENILNPRFKDIGIAFVSSTIDGKKTNILVEFFATDRVSLMAKPSAVSIPARHLEPTVAKTQTKIMKEMDRQSSVTVKKSHATSKANDVISKNNSSASIVPLVKKPIEKNTADNIDPPKIDPQISVAGLALDQGNVGSAEANNIGNENPSIIETPRADPESYKSTTGNIDLFLAIIFLMLLGVLAINILIEISIQHKPVIVQTMITAILIIGLIALEFDQFKIVIDKVAVL